MNLRNLQLWFDNGDLSLTVRRFAVHEELSEPFTVDVWAYSENSDLDLEQFVQQPARLTANNGRLGPTAGLRSWTGVVAKMELLQTEETGVSLYYMRIVPRLWLMTQRVNRRVMQHQDAPSIVKKLLDEWSIKHEWQVDPAQHPRLEIRTQYGETDYAFMCRLLAESGISFSFAADPDQESLLQLHDAPQTRKPRAGRPIVHTDHPNPEAGIDYVTRLQLSQEVRPDSTSIRDHDFRRHTSFKLFGGARAPGIVADRAARPDLEIYGYEPGSSIVEKAASGATAKGGNGQAQPNRPLVEAIVNYGKDKLDKLGKAIKRARADGDDADPMGDADHAPQSGEAAASGGLFSSLAGQISARLGADVADMIADVLASDDKGEARHQQPAANFRAQKRLEALRTDRRTVWFDTNAIDLSAGTVLHINHVRSDLSPQSALLITAFSMQGNHDDDWGMSARCVFANLPYRPQFVGDKPRMQGLQSAVVVGPAGEDIYTDETGRIRIQFHWDREGQYNDDSYCWARVAQAWAGPGFGLLNIPRVGHEVLVAFLEGDPDNPVVVGSFFNATAPVPYALPANKTRSVWRSNTSPGSNGYNEIMFDDQAGAELLFMQAQHDHIKTVKHDEIETTGHNRTISVAKDRKTHIGQNDESLINSRYTVAMVPRGGSGLQTSIEMVDGRITLSTGEASLSLEGPHIYLMAKGNIKIKSTDDDVEIEGGPWVKINCGAEGDVEADTFVMHHVKGVVRDQDGDPVAGLTVMVTDSEGNVQQVQTDDSGSYTALVMPGECQISTPNLRSGLAAGAFEQFGDGAMPAAGNGPFIS